MCVNGGGGSVPDWKFTGSDLHQAGEGLTHVTVHLLLSDTWDKQGSQVCVGMCVCVCMCVSVDVCACACV